MRSSNWLSVRLWLAGCFAVLLSACSLIRDQADPSTVSIRGVPPTLEQLNLSTTAYAQDLMVNELVRTAGLSSQPPPNDPNWSLVMKAGVYEISRQCDQYLDALFRFNRQQRAGRQDLAAAAAATGAIMGIAGASVEALAITAAAFGLASSLFDASVNSVLFTIEPSALRNVALQGRKKYLDDLQKNNIKPYSRPDVLIILQGYLTQCSPAAIEANINNAASGAPSVVVPDRDKPEQAAVLAAPATVLLKPGPPTELGPPPAPEKPAEGVRSRSTGVPSVSANYARFLEDPKVPLSSAQLEAVFAALCILPDEVKDINDKPTTTATARIKAFQQAENYRRGQPMPSATGRLTRREIEILKSRPKCDRTRYQNSFEAYSLWPGGGPPGDINSKDLIDAMNLKIEDPGKKLPIDATVEDVRSRIPVVREAVAKKLVLTDGALSNQLTRDLVSALVGGN